MHRKQKKRLALAVVAVLGAVVAAGGGYTMWRAQRTDRAQQSKQAGVQAYERGDYREAMLNIGHYISYINRTGTGGPDDAPVAVMHARARLAIPQENFKHVRSAMGITQLAVELDPENLDAHELLLELYVQTRRVTEGLAMAQRVLEIEPDNMNAMQVRVFFLEEVGRRDAAAEAIRSFLLAHPDHPSAQYQAIKVRVDAGAEPEDVVAYAEEIAQRVEDPLDAVMLVAESQLMVGDVEGAVERMADAPVQTAAGTERVARLMWLLDVLAAQDARGITPVANTILETLLANDPDDEQLAAFAAARAWQRGDFELVGARLEKIVAAPDRASDEAVGWAVLAHAFLPEETPKPGAEVLRDELERRAGEDHDGNDAARCWAVVRAAEHVGKGRPAAAIQTLDNANDLWVGAIEDWGGPAAIVRNRALLQMAEASSAVDAVSHLVQLPSWRTARAAAVDAHLAAGRYQDAIATLRHEPNLFGWPRGVALLAQTRLRLAESDEATARDTAAAVNLLAVLVDAQAVAAEHGKNNNVRARINALVFYGRALLADGQETPACTVAEEVVALLGDAKELEAMPEIAPFVRRLMAIDWGLGARLANAQETAVQGLDAEALLTTAVLAAADGRPQEGLDGLQDAMEKAANPAEEAEIRRAIARYLAAAGMPDAGEAMAAIARERDTDARAQLEALRTVDVWRDLALADECIQRLRTLTGDGGAAWRMYEARRMLMAEPESDRAARDAVFLLAEALRIEPGNASAMAIAGEAYVRLGDTQRAIDRFTRALQTSPGEVGVYAPLIHQLQNAGLTEQAGRWLDAFMDVPRLQQAERRRRAGLLERQGMLQEAAEDRAAILDETESSEDMLAMASLYAKMGLEDRVAALLQELGADGGLAPRTRVGVAGLLADAGDTEAALGILDGLPDTSEIGRKGMVVGVFLAERERFQESLAHVLQDAAQTDDPDSWLTAARIRMGLQDLQGAAEAVRRGLLADPTHAALRGLSGVLAGAQPDAAADDPVHLFALAQALAYAEQSEEHQRLQRAVNKIPNNATPADVDAFTEKLRAFTEEKPAFYPAWRLLWQAQVVRGAPAEAAETARRASVAIPADPRPAKEAAELHKAIGSLDAAAMLAISWRERDAAMAYEVDVFLGDVEIQRGRFQEAVKRLGPWTKRIVEEAAQQRGAGSRGLSLLAQAMAGDGRLEALDAILWPRARTRAAWTAAAVAAAVHTAAAAPEAADTMLDRAEAAIDAMDDPQRLPMAAMHARFAVANTTGGDAEYRVALERIDAIARNRDTLQTHERRGLAAMRGVCLQRLGRLDEAETVYREGLELGAADPGLLQNLAALLLTKEPAAHATEVSSLASRAIEILHKQGEQQAALADLYAIRAAASLAQGQTQEGLRDAETGMGIAPSNRMLLIAMAQARLDAGDEAGAAQALRRPVLLRDRVGVATVLSQRYEAINNPGAALRVYRLMLDSEPNDPILENNLADLLVRLGKDLEEAIGLARNAAARAQQQGLEPELCAMLYETYGTAAAAAGRHDEAVEAFRDAIGHHAEHAGAALRLGESLVAMGRLQEAVAAVEGVDEGALDRQQRERLGAVRAKKVQ